MSLRRRFIVDSDLDAVADLLARGFPRRDLRSWQRGLRAMQTRPLAADLPRYGLLLESDGQIVGVLLMIYGALLDGGLRCSLSSWYVEPRFSLYGPMLLNAASGAPGVSYLNVTPAPHTEEIIAAQGFRRFCRGFYVYVAAASRYGQKLAVSRWTTPAAVTAAFGHLPEHQLILDHLALGCVCLSVQQGGEEIPYLFARPRPLRGILPGTHLLYARSLHSFEQHAGALGRALLKCGALVVLVDSEEKVGGMIARHVNQAQGKYFAGPKPPRFGDGAFAEYAVFGG